MLKEEASDGDQMVQINVANVEYLRAQGRVPN